MKEFERYALAVLAYVAVSFYTQKYLTWLWGPLFFLALLEALPRGWRWLRRLVRTRKAPATPPQLVPTLVADVARGLEESA